MQLCFRFSACPLFLAKLGEWADETNIRLRTLSPANSILFHRLPTFYTEERGVMQVSEGWYTAPNLGSLHRKDLEMAQYNSTVTTNETDVDSSGKKSTKDITATTAPAQTNQYEHADWRLSSALPSATIAFFDVAGSYAQAIFLGIHRITNEWNQDVIVETEHFKTRVGPSRSIDVSSAQVTISAPPGVGIDDANPPHGTYMLLCCSIAVAQASAAKLTGTDHPRSIAEDAHRRRWWQ